MCMRHQGTTCRKTENIIATLELSGSQMEGQMGMISQYESTDQANTCPRLSQSCSEIYDWTASPPSP